MTCDVIHSFPFQGETYKMVRLKKNFSLLSKHKEMVAILYVGYNPARISRGYRFGLRGVCGRQGDLIFRAI